MKNAITERPVPIKKTAKGFSKFLILKRLDRAAIGMASVIGINNQLPESKIGVPPRAFSTTL